MHRDTLHVGGIPEEHFDEIFGVLKETPIIFPLVQVRSQGLSGRSMIWAQYCDREYAARILVALNGYLTRDGSYRPRATFSRRGLWERPVTTT